MQVTRFGLPFKKGILLRTLVWRLLLLLLVTFLFSISSP
jgi:hypothetical protein